MIETRKLLALILSSTFALSFGSLFSSAQATPQTARQALLEMFFSKTPGTFEQHLPQATRAALRKASPTSGASMATGLSAMTSQLSAQGQQLQTFEAGPTLILLENLQTHTKFEVTVERDDLRGDEDEIELAFHGSKDGETQTAGAKFRLNLTMRQESGTWRLDEVSASVGVSLSDPEFLKTMTKNISAGVHTSAGGMSTSAAMSAMNPAIAANESSSIAGIRALNTAEITYAAGFPGHGFTCTLSDLGGMGSGTGPSERQAMLIDPRLASGRKNGYVFALSGCNGTPASRYSVTAVPADPSSGTRAFCSDESAVIRFSADGKANSCLSIGKPLQ
jgi:hypothetical protein